MSEAYDMGAYEPVYDEYEEGLADGKWVQRDGTSISICKMSDNHIKNAIRLCQHNADSATWECDTHKWEAWVSLLEDELYNRKTKITDVSLTSIKIKKKKKASKTIKQLLKSVKCSKVLMQCSCGQQYEARVADLKRGWALSCSKRCAAIRREFGSCMPVFKREL
ncbi:hypothetical protein PQD09_gp69 [Providencia phage PSTCR4]|uniref:Uncharacterized protein n=1 Tax=Providencia phage PSTCR4 TaxID=2783546 RepID=A0A873WHJ6_9CAUD|nr:hypothetical protein PQD09_gp69 [Providencia phage PSTCR4]QPB12090.1 hypothetical protein [Providencia phage PSTCR4]